MILHGIYGSGRNWRSVARGLVDLRADWGVALVDLRQHGRSRGFPPPHTLEAAAEDLRGVVRTEGLSVESILGHSFGGKVAMAYAGRPVGRLTSLWVVDSFPGAREPEGGAWRMLRVLEDHPGPFSDRETALESVRAGGFSLPVAQWMTTNLERDPEGGFRWRLQVDEMRSLLLDFFETDAWTVVESPREGLEVHVVKAGESGLLDDEACRRIEAAGSERGTTHLHVLEGGHWLNVDNPTGLIELLGSTL
jgi:pimeloyl-ACP methyl ester carboxylesterase